MRPLFRALMFLVIVAMLVAIVFRARYGGPLVTFPERATAPTNPKAAFEIVATLDTAPGNIAVAPDGRIFFTFHPEGRPDGDKLVEWKDGKAIPFPGPEWQHGRGEGMPYFDTALGIRLDAKGRLWVIDHGFHGLRQPRLLAFDINTRALVAQVDFSREVAGRGSFLQDLAVDPEGRYVYIADANVLAKKPALIVYDSVEKVAFRRLEGHLSVVDKSYLVSNKGRPMVLLGGLFNLHAAVDSIALDRKGEWLYFAPMSHEDLFRVRAADLRDRGTVDDDELRRRVENFAPKIQTDGITTDADGTIYLSDIERGAIATVNQERQLKTYFVDRRIRWPDGMSFGPGGWLYFTDSDLPDLMLRSKGHMKQSAPYYIFRVQTGKTATPAGQ